MVILGINTNAKMCDIFSKYNNIYDKIIDNQNLHNDKLLF